MHDPHPEIWPLTTRFNDIVIALTRASVDAATRRQNGERLTEADYLHLHMLVEESRAAHQDARAAWAALQELPLDDETEATLLGIVDESEALFIEARTKDRKEA